MTAFEKELADTLFAVLSRLEPKEDLHRRACVILDKVWTAEQDARTGRAPASVARRALDMIGLGLAANDFTHLLTSTFIAGAVSVLSGGGVRMTPELELALARLIAEARNAGEAIGADDCDDPAVNCAACLALREERRT